MVLHTVLDGALKCCAHTVASSTRQRSLASVSRRLRPSRLSQVPCGARGRRAARAQFSSCAGTATTPSHWKCSGTAISSILSRSGFTPGTDEVLAGCFAEWTAHLPEFLSLKTNPLRRKSAKKCPHATRAPKMLGRRSIAGNDSTQVPS